MRLAAVRRVAAQASATGDVVGGFVLDTGARDTVVDAFASLLITGAAIGVTIALDITLDVQTSLVMLAAVMAIGWYGGLRSALIAIALTAGAFAYVLFEPHLHIGAAVSLGQVVIYVVIASALAGLMDRIALLMQDRERMVARVERANSDLAAANDLKDEFVGLVSHELRSPITTIQGNAQVLARHGDTLDAETRRASLTDIADESARLAGIVDDLLTLARLDRGVSLPIEPVTVQPLVHRVIDAHRRQHPQRKISLEAPEQRLVAMAVPVYVEQTLGNLLTNAEKYSPVVEPIDVRVVRAGDMANVLVTDHGAGIPADERETVFVPFYRSASTARSTSGFGVGLAVCKRMVESQGGSIWVDSPPDASARFGFSLPLVINSGD